jgi:hippurate hydrolase
MSTVERARELQDELTELRRALHREPELGLHLPRTQEKVLAALDGLPLEISTGRSLSSVTAVLRGTGGPGGAVLLRGDMDALPIQETTGLDYASRSDGRMHACGHDLHTAGLVGAARLLCDRRERLSGDVVFMFQPGEEGFNGAGLMIEEGVLDAAGKKLDAAYAIHVSAGLLPSGLVYARPGAMMSACDELRVTVHGLGGHGSTPHRTKDPVPAVCEMVTALHAHVTRTFDIFDPVVVSVGRLSAGVKSNIIPESAEFAATVRSYSEENRELLRTGLPALVEGIARAHGLDAEVEYDVLYPVTVNTPEETGFALDVARELFGPEGASLAPNPISGSEDFSLVLERVPGAMLFLGAILPDLDLRTAPGNHAPSAAFDDGVLFRQAALLADLATRRLAGTAV